MMKRKRKRTIHLGHNGNKDEEMDCNNKEEEKDPGHDKEEKEDQGGD